VTYGYYNAKRTIVSIMLETVRWNSGDFKPNQSIGSEKAFDLLRDENLVHPE